MAAPITTSASTLEGQVAEVIGALQIAEDGVTDETLKQNRVQIQFDIDNKEITVTATLPASFTSNGAAQTMTPVAYIS
jgi:hypothetical protein